MVSSQRIQHRKAAKNTINITQRVIFVTLLLLSSTVVAIANDLRTKLDSLQQELSHASEDTTRVDLYLKIGRAYENVQLDSTFFYIRKAISLSHKLDDRNSLQRSYGWMAVKEAKYGSLKQAKIYLEKVLAIAQPHEDAELLSNIYNNIGLSYHHRAEYTSALQYLQKALSLDQSIQDTLSAAYTISNIGLVYHSTGDYKQAIAFHEQALSTFQYFNKRPESIQVSSNVGIAFINLGDYTKALHYYQEALQEARAIQNKPHEVLVLNNIASMYINQKQYATALTYAQQALATQIAISPETENRNLTVENTLGEIYTGLHQYKRALIHHHNAVAIMEAQQEFAYMSIYNDLIHLDSLMGNFRQAFLHQQRFMALKDSLANIDKTKAVEELKVQYETEQKNQEITLLQEQSTRQQLEARQQRLVKNSFIAGSAALFLLLGLGYNRYRFKQNALRVMSQQKAEILTQKQRVDRQNEENQLLLKEIHHRVKNNLQIVLSILNAQADSLSDPQAVSAILESQHRVHSMALIHQNLYQSDNLSRIQAQRYLRETVETVYSSYRQAAQSVRLRLDIEDLSLDMSTAVPLGLIVTELVTNACKHAFAGAGGELTVSLRAETALQYRLTVTDDGPGLPTDFDVDRSPSLGLQLVQGLTQQLEGELVMQSGPGTRFEVLFQQAA